jgi:ligand-binding SRPBCC domain-containing protein
MPIIELQAMIHADIEVVFDLSRSIEFHQLAANQTHERAISGKTTGLIGMNESVTWRARHFGVYQNLTSTITAFDRPSFFVDEMVQGAFKSFKHEHFFEKVEGGTLMKDRFDYTSPLGVLGVIADAIFLERYMTKFLKQRNAAIKLCAESGDWKRILST